MKLTEKEFETIIEALDKFPSTKTDGKVLSRVIATVLCKDDEEAKLKMQAEIEKKEAEEEAEARKTKKLVGIIQGKLYMMQEEIVEKESEDDEGKPTETVE